LKDNEILSVRKLSQVADVPCSVVAREVSSFLTDGVTYTVGYLETEQMALLAWYNLP
jgi:hypothetical protein